MASKNDITGDSIQTKAVSQQYRDNYDLIFRKPLNMSGQNQNVTTNLAKEEDGRTPNNNTPPNH